ncbi:hypothetical protein DL546_007127 [Coniochaeta pulveracea]|uniref:Tyrosine specific protein phosphatases domain-containing protein n=1 Tax=Coniochaeta pulveracea TaxID=177199 RepID=A0A420YDR0_9PEZI|nr:hypothetical protein DL546_007127 [Coniochaeta pulveracea]
MDLRTKTEHIQALQKHKATQEARLSHVRSNDAVAEPLKIDGVRNLEIRLTGKAFEKHLTSQLSWSSYLKLASLYIVGYRTDAISIIGREVMQPRGLIGLAADTLDCSGVEIKEALQSFLDPEGLPAMVHCTQGKDRTGIIVMLVLMILGVLEAAIEYDYELSDEGLAAEKESRLAEIRAIGLSDDFGGVAKDMTAAVRRHLDENYSGLEKYLDNIGFDAREREKLRNRLTY